MTAYMIILRAETARKARALRARIAQEQDSPSLPGWSVDPARARSRARFLRTIRNRIVRRYINTFIGERR